MWGELGNYRSGGCRSPSNYTIRELLRFRPLVDRKNHARYQITERIALAKKALPVSLPHIQGQSFCDNRSELTMIRRKIEKWRRNFRRKHYPSKLEPRMHSYLDVARTTPKGRGNIALEEEYRSILERIALLNRNIGLQFDAEDNPARDVPEQTGVALVRIPRSPGSTAALFKNLISASLSPALRDRGDEGCSVLFVHSEVARDLWPRQAYPRQGEVPVLVPCFNNPTYCDMMLDQLWEAGFDDIRFVDNASTSSQMHDWLRREDGRRRIIRLAENMGPNRSVNELRHQLPRHFCVTDPDILFNGHLPADFLSQLRSLTSRHALGKAGFALDISRSHLFKAETADDAISMETQWWERPLHFTKEGDRVFEALLDTTFCVIDQKFYRLHRTYDAVRVAGRYTAIHLPWEGRSQIPTYEREDYARTQLYSSYRNL